MPCDDLEAGMREEWEGGPTGREYMYVYLQLIQMVIQQKPIQHCKAIILQLKKINLNKNKQKRKSYQTICTCEHCLALTRASEGATINDPG